MHSVYTSVFHNPHGDGLTCTFDITTSWHTVTIARIHDPSANAPKFSRHWKRQLIENLCAQYGGRRKFRRLFHVFNRRDPDSSLMITVRTKSPVSIHELAGKVQFAAEQLPSKDEWRDMLQPA